MRISRLRMRAGSLRMSRPSVARDSGEPSGSCHSGLADPRHLTASHCAAACEVQGDLPIGVACWNEDGAA